MACRQRLPTKPNQTLRQAEYRHTTETRGHLGHSWCRRQEALYTCNFRALHTHKHARGGNFRALPEAHHRARGLSGIAGVTAPQRHTGLTT